MSTKELIKRLFLRVSAILLPVSLGAIIVAMTIAVVGDIHFPRFTISLFSLASGIVLAFAGSIIRTRLRFFFGASLLCLLGAFFLFIDVGAIAMPLPGIWPFFMLFTALSFMIAGILVYRALHPTYLVPSLAFAALGLIFLLFSTNIIPFSITSLVMWWFPLLALPGLVSLIIWISQRRHAVREGS